MSGPAEQVNWMGDYITRTYGDTAVTFTYGAGGNITAGMKTAGMKIALAADGTLVTPDHLCPDLLRWENIGAADGLRGRVVRAFFWLMRAWNP